MADQKLSQLTEDASLSLADLLYTVEDPSGSPISKKATYATLAALLADGWIPYSTVVPTSGVLDTPSFELVFAGVDLTSFLRVGMKVRLTQSTTKYFIITKSVFSTNTTITLYGGTDYVLVATGTTVVSNFYYSPHKSPSGFPLDPDKWTVKIADTAYRAQDSPVQNQWYNLGAVKITIPIGIWKVSYKATASGFFTAPASGFPDIHTTLSQVNNLESDSEFHVGHQIFVATGLKALSFSQKVLNLSVKTDYFLNSLTQNTGITKLENNNSEVPLIIKALSEYL